MSTILGSRIFPEDTGSGDDEEVDRVINRVSRAKVTVEGFLEGP